MGRGAAPFEHFLVRGNPVREWGRMLVLHIQDAANKRFVQGEENARSQGREGWL